MMADEAYKRICELHTEIEQLIGVLAQSANAMKLATTQAFRISLSAGMTVDGCLEDARDEVNNILTAREEREEDGGAE